MRGLFRRVGPALTLIMVLLPHPAQAFVTRVDAAGTAFTPPKIQIELGDSVIWEARDDGHTVTAADGSFDSSSRGVMSEGDQFRWRFRAPGTYAYYCRVHQSRGMKGEVVVVDPSAAPTTTSTRPVPVPVTAAATTSTTALSPVPVTQPTTATTRVLATSSTTSGAIATSTTVPAGAELAPQGAVPINPQAPVVGTAEADAQLPEAQAAAQRSEASDDLVPALVIGLVALLALFGGAMGVRAQRRRRA